VHVLAESFSWASTYTSHPYLSAMRGCLGGEDSLFMLLGHLARAWSKFNRVGVSLRMLFAVWHTTAVRD
jgi:hypothetical protein